MKIAHAKTETDMIVWMNSKEYEWEITCRDPSKTTNKKRIFIYLNSFIAVQRQEVWRPALYFYIQDHYTETPNQSRAETITSLYNQWKELSSEQKQPYLQQSNAVTKVNTEVRASFPFTCYCSLFKLYEQKKNPSKFLWWSDMNRVESIWD